MTQVHFFYQTLHACMHECKALEIDGSFHFPKAAWQNYTS